MSMVTTNQQTSVSEPKHLQSHHGKVARQTLVYAIAAVLAKVLWLALAPLLLNPQFLSLREYGEFVVLESTWTLMIALLGFGLPSAIPRFTLGSDQDIQARAEGTALVLVAAFGGLAIISASLIFVFGNAISLPSTVVTYSIPVALYITLKIIAAIPLAVLRTHERVVQFSLAGIVESVTVVVGAILALGYFRAGLTGLIYSHILGALSACLASFALGNQLIRVKFSLQLVWPMLRYGGGILACGLCLSLVSISDRYLVGWFVGLEAVAVYGWAARLASVLRTVLVVTFQRSFHVVSLTLNQSNSIDRNAFITKIFRLYVVVAGALAALISVSAFDLTLALSSNPVYAECDFLVLLLSLSNMLYGVFYITADELLANARTWRLAATVAVTAIVNLFLGVAFVSMFGPAGAALATMCSFAVLGVISASISSHDERISFPWRSLIMTGLVIFAIFLASLPTKEWAIASRLVIRGGLLACYPLALVVLRVVLPNEISACGKSCVSAINMYIRNRD